MSIMKFTYRTTELNWNSFSSRDSNILWMMNELILANLYTLNEQMEKRERLHTLYSIWFYSSIGKHFCRMIKSNLRIFLQQIEIVKIAHLKCQKIKLDPRKWFFKGKAWWQPFNRLDNIFFFFFITLTELDTLTDEWYIQRETKEESLKSHHFKTDSRRMEVEFSFPGEKKRVKSALGEYCTSDALHHFEFTSI